MKKIMCLGFLVVTFVGVSHALLSDHNRSLDEFRTIDLDSNLGLGGLETSADDEFGYALANGDYNGDGFIDLAIGIPSYDFNLFVLIENSGAVLVMFGSPSGLGSDSVLLIQDASIDDLEENDFFGRTLVTGDFNGDGIDDLVVGVPAEDLFSSNSLLNAGAVNIFYGSNDNFGDSYALINTDTGSQATANVEALDQFGRSLAAGDFDADGFDDLAVGTPLEDLGNVGQNTNQGQVHVFYGSSSGVDVEDREVLTQNSFNVLEDAEAGDLFGWSLAAADFDGDGVDDLAVGVPGEEVDGEDEAGIVHIFSGSTVSGVSTNDYIRSQSGAVAGLVEAGDEFGHSLATGDINGDGFADLVVGVWREDSNAAGLVDNGAINVLYGNSASLSENGSQIITQENSDVMGTGADNERFGDVVLLADLNHDGFDDVIVGTPNDIGFDGSGMVDQAGGINVLYGSASGVSLNGDEYRPANALNDQYGHALAVGQFGSSVELVVGLPGNQSTDADLDAGAIEVIGLTPADLIFKNGFGAIAQ